MPTLEAKPEEVKCRLDGLPATCVVLIREDYRALVRELKAACLALGGTAADCGTD